MVVLLLLVFLTTAINAKFSISSACYKDEDSLLKYIKPTADGPVIPVICSNGFTMIDVGLNKDAITEYFTSFQEYNSLLGQLDSPLSYGPGCNDWVSWREFWTPATSKTKFRVASGCASCETSTYSAYDENVAYYMTNSFFLFKLVLHNDCRRDKYGDPYDYTYNTFDKTTTMCNLCDMYKNGLIENNKKWEDCPSLQLSANTITDHSSLDKDVLGENMLVQPSVAGDRSYCTCYRPSTKHITTYMVGKNELPEVAFEYKEYLSSSTIDANIIWETVEIEINDCSKVYYLSNSDFKDGTLKLKMCGEYILSEDISVNFNAPSDEVQARDDFSPNSIDVEDLYWYPTTAQQESDEYPGADAFHGLFQFGFFAAISIQTDDVTINLNGFKIEMDMKYYLQQRFFSIIELGNRNFINKQGQALDLGKGFIPVSNIVIKDGFIGRVSHHGIHGNAATNVQVSNVGISDFDVAGLQFNGFANVEITDVVVGPQSPHIPVLGQYLHGRVILPRMRYFADLFGDKIIPFGDHNPHKESKTVSELVQTLITQMDMIYFHIIDDAVNDKHDEDWIDAQSVFLNTGGWLDGGSAYGIVINGRGTGVIPFGRRSKQGSNIVLKNVEIFDIALSTIERVWATLPDADRYEVHGFVFDNFDWNKITNADDGRYVGDAYTDLVFAAGELMMDDLCFLNQLYTRPVREWVFSDDQTIELVFAGGSDIQSHDAKGAMGLRVDQTQSFTAENVYVHDITNFGALGSMECCGEWDTITFLTAENDVEPGYTASRAHGILLDFMDGSLTDIVIENIESHYGSAIGMSLYKGSGLSKLENIEITNVNAGSKLSKKEAHALTLPNILPFACSVEFGVNTDGTDKHLIYITQMDEESIVGRNIYGHDVCEDERLVGSIVNDEENVEYGSILNYLPLMMNWYGWMFILFAFLSTLAAVYYCYRRGSYANVKKNFETNYGAVNFYSDM